MLKLQQDVIERLPDTIIRAVNDKAGYLITDGKFEIFEGNDGEITLLFYQKTHNTWLRPIDTDNWRTAHKFTAILGSLGSYKIADNVSLEQGIEAIRNFKGAVLQTPSV